MDCRKLRQEIAELSRQYEDAELQYEKAEESGRGESLKKALQGFDKIADELLEKYLPDFQGQFGDKLGIGEAYIEGEIKELGDRVVSTPWGDSFAIIEDVPFGEGLYSVIRSEDGGLLRGELIVAGKYNLGVFPMSDERLLLPTKDEVINVIRKENNAYVLDDSIRIDEIGRIRRLVALSESEWIINATNGVYIFNEGLDGKLVLGEKIDLNEVSSDFSSPDVFLPLSSNEVLISDDGGGTVIFERGDSGRFTFVQEIFGPIGFGDEYISGATLVDDNRWLVCNRGEDEWFFLTRGGSQSQPFELGDSIRKILNIDVWNFSHLSRNEFLVENDNGDIFIFTMRSDGSFGEGDKIADGDGKQDENSYIRKTIPLSDDTWLVSKDFPLSDDYALGRNHILQRRKNGKYELGEKLEGIDYAFNGAIRLPGGRYLLSDGYGQSRSNEAVPKEHDLSMLSFRYTFKDIEDLKDDLSRIIVAGEV